MPLNGIGVAADFDMATQSEPGRIQPLNDQLALLEVVPRAMTVSSFSVAATPSSTTILVGLTATVRAELYPGSVNAGLTPVPGATCTFNLDIVTTQGFPYGCTASPSAQIAAGQVAVVLFTLTTSTSSSQPLNQTIPLYVSTGTVAS